MRCYEIIKSTSATKNANKLVIWHKIIGCQQTVYMVGDARKLSLQPQNSSLRDACLHTSCIFWTIVLRKTQCGKTDAVDMRVLLLCSFWIEIECQKWLTLQRFSLAKSSPSTVSLEPNISLLGPYNTSNYPTTIVVIPHYLYCCAPITPILLFLCPIESLYCYFCGFLLLLLGRLGYIVAP